MTFGKFKSFIENNLIESYKNENDFKKKLREFRHNVLNNKSISKIYSVYDQLSTPQGLSEKDAKLFLEEGVDLLARILPHVKLPKTIQENINNNYQDIDVLVYNTKVDLHERLDSRKKIIDVLTKDKKLVKESINIPIKTMVNVANQTLRSYVDSLDETSKKEFFQLINEDTKVLENTFEKMKNEGIEKLSSILESENDNDIKEKISETINKLKTEKFDQLNFVRIKSLVNSI
jgi:hypothetical protein